MTSRGLGEDRTYERLSPGCEPEYLHAAYVSTHKRAPSRPPVVLPSTETETTGPRFEAASIGEAECDLTRQSSGEPIGERIVIAGRLVDEDGRPLANALVEVWQANAAGRYAHDGDRHDAPLDPNFEGAGRVVTDRDGRYRFVTIKPGAYPWRNHANAWRPAHVHFSVFGPAFATRLVTQMYFPGDPLLEHDPIFHAVADPLARNRLIAAFDWQATSPEWALGYRFDVVLRGRRQTPFEGVPRR